MRVACFSPLPPSKSGIADYAAALLPRLAERVELDVFLEDGRRAEGHLRLRDHRDYRSGDFDVTLYQVGNNPDHVYLYRAARQHSGVAVLHEFNLHHLVAAATITRQDWDGYLQEVEHNGGETALAHARRVRALEVGPDYDLPLNRRLLDSSRALIVHSRFMESQVREAGFSRPIAVIPHGAEIAEAPRHERRRQLGLDETTPLIGVFGFLKPYKRITQTLRAFHRLVRNEPRVRMILVGEEHPELPLRPLIASLGLEAHVRVLGYVTLTDFQEYIGACDICVNLRYPTVGESSGTLLRAMGMGRAVLVSNVGSFSELPDDACLKVPVDDRETDLLHEYLNLLVHRPEVARALGDRARRYVVENCTWNQVAEQYANFLQAIAEGRDYHPPFPEPRPPTPDPRPPSPIPHPPAPIPHPWAEYILSYAGDSRQRLDYTRTHLTRLVRTLEITPRGTAGDRILEMGAYMLVTPALKHLLGYGEVRGSYLGPAGGVDHREARSSGGDVFCCEIDLFDAEKDRFPYPDGRFATVLCCELIEHLYHDPMHLMSEINRVLQPGGTLVVTTPNICSLRAIDAILQRYHPGFFHQYIRPAEDGAGEPRHNREYAPRDIQTLFEQAGFEVARLETGPFRAAPSASQEWVVHLLDRYGLSQELRGEGIYAVGRRVGPVKNRYPAGLYAGDAA